MPVANRLLFTIMAGAAEHEAEAISAYTKVALAAAKARGTRLGGFRGYDFSAADRCAASAAKKARSAAHAARVRRVIDELRVTGATSLRALAAQLIQLGIPAPGGSTWHANTVRRLLDAKPA